MMRHRSGGGSTCSTGLINVERSLRPCATSCPRKWWVDRDWRWVDRDRRSVDRECRSVDRRWVDRR